MIRPRHYKARRKPRVRLRAPLVLLCLLAFALAWDGTGVLRIGLLCALLHESGHAVVYRMQWGCWPDLQLSPFGICLLLRGTPLSARQELVLAAAGPVVNLTVCCGVLLAMDITGHYTYAGYWFAGCNLLVGGVNLLPLPGLDGWRILQALGW